MNTIDAIALTPAGLMVLAAGLGVVASLAALATVMPIVRRRLRQEIKAAVVDVYGLPVTQLTVSLVANATDEGVNLEHRIGVLTQGQLQAEFVQAWLDQRDLVMMPRATDYKAKSPSP